jgi:serine/threonine protein kinase
LLAWSFFSQSKAFCCNVLSPSFSISFFLSFFTTFLRSIHRDLKYENILFVNASPHAGIKLIDFGLSKQFSEDEAMKESMGTM